MKGIIGFILLVGTVGALEQGNIEMVQCLIQSVVGLALLYTQSRKEEI